MTFDLPAEVKKATEEAMGKPHNVKQPATQEEFLQAALPGGLYRQHAQPGQQYPVPTREQTLRSIADQISAVHTWECLEVSDWLVAPLMAVLERHYESDNPKLGDVQFYYKRLQEALQEAAYKLGEA